MDQMLGRGSWDRHAAVPQCGCGHGLEGGTATELGDRKRRKHLRCGDNASGSERGHAA